MLTVIRVWLLQTCMVHHRMRPSARSKPCRLWQSMMRTFTPEECRWISLCWDYWYPLYQVKLGQLYQWLWRCVCKAINLAKNPLVMMGDLKSQGSSYAIGRNALFHKTMLSLYVASFCGTVSPVMHALHHWAIISWKQFCNLLLHYQQPLIRHNWCYILRIGSVATMHGRSMQPTLNPADDNSWPYLNGDLLYLEKFPLRTYSFSRGDVVVFRCVTLVRSFLEMC